MSDNIPSLFPEDELESSAPLSPKKEAPRPSKPKPQHTEPATPKPQPTTASKVTSSPSLGEGLEVGSSSPSLGEGPEVGSPSPSLGEGSEVGSSSPSLGEGLEVGSSSPSLGEGSGVGSSSSSSSPTSSSSPLGGSQKGAFWGSQKGAFGGALFPTFFHIGLFTIGGGYAMIPLIEAKIVDEKKWITREELLDLMAVAQSCPGIFAVNIAIFIGYKLQGVPGAIKATLGCVLPSFLIILAIALFFRQFQDNQWVARAFRGIRPCVVALIAAPTFKMAQTAKIGWTNVWIPVLGAFLIWMFGVSPIWIIVAAGIGGFLYGKFVATEPSE